MCSQDDAPDTKKHFTRAPVQDRLLPGDRCSSFRPFLLHQQRRLLVRTGQPPHCHLHFKDIPEEETLGGGISFNQCWNGTGWYFSTHLRYTMQ